MSDRGAEALKNELHAWICGVRRLVPEAWTKTDHYRAKMDPEYAKYLELKKRYG